MKAEEIIRVFKNSAKARDNHRRQIGFSTNMFEDFVDEAINMIKTRFIPGEDGIICRVCRHPILITKFEWSECKYKTCPGCETILDLGTYPGVRP